MAARTHLLSAAAILVIAICAHAQDDPHRASYESEGFIRVQGERFVDEACKEYFFTGWNSWALVDKASVIVRYPLEATRVINGKNFIEYMMDEARAAGFNMLRLFGHGVEEATRLQTAPGVYDENVFKGMDYVISEAGKRGIKLIVSFSTNWGDIDSRNQFMGWDGTTPNKDAFWVKESIKQMYKDHIKKTLTRENTYNGLVYMDDPNIFAWNIYNEMRCYSTFCETERMGWKWNREMAQYIKSIDKNHLLTIGHEGFYNWGCPTGPAAFPTRDGHTTGQDFVRDSSIPEIDFAGIHLWPDNWEVEDIYSFPLQWVQEHAKDSKRYIKKPLLLEEFGIETKNDDGERRTRRDPVFKTVYEEVEKSLESSGGVRAAMFWEWFVSDEEEISIHGVTKSHSTWKILMKHTKKIAELNAQKKTVAQCVPGKSSSKVESIEPNNQFQIKGCCDDDCNTKYADYKGEVFQESSTASPGECCRACKFANIRAGTQVCAGWSWCPCGSCGDAEKNTCQLKKSQHPFYHAYWVQGKGQSWISGSLGSGDKDLPSWKCQPTGECAYNANCSNFKESIKCADDTCGAMPTSIGGDEETIIFNVNGHARPFDASNPPPITSVAECCAKCKETAGCNAWRYCAKEEGCGMYKKPCNEFRDKLGLGPHDDCAKGGQNYPKHMCTLLNVDKSKLVPRIGFWIDYVSGVLLSPEETGGNTGK